MCVYDMHSADDLIMCLGALMDMSVGILMVLMRCMDDIVHFRGIWMERCFVWRRNYVC